MRLAHATAPTVAEVRFRDQVLAGHLQFAAIGCGTLTGAPEARQGYASGH
jgi:hypothetical protein